MPETIGILADVHYFQSVRAENTGRESLVILRVLGLFPMLRMSHDQASFAPGTAPGTASEYSA